MSNNNIKIKNVALFNTLLKKKKNKTSTWVLAHPAILCHSIQLHLPGTTDELGDDHWVLLEDKQQ